MSALAGAGAGVDAKVKPIGLVVSDGLLVAFVSLEALLPNSGGGAADSFDSFAEGAVPKVNFELLLGTDDSAVLDPN